jgi:hypothetical protein
VILCVPSWCIDSLTLYLLMWRICWAPNNASKQQVGFNWAFERLILFVVDNMHSLRLIPLFTRLIQNERINYIYLQLDFVLYRVTTYSAVKIFNK